MPITRSEIIQRAATIWPLSQVEYCQKTVRNPGWRTDCSGYVSMCLDLSKPGKSTVTLVTDGDISEITRDELLPGDMVGRCGEGTAGNNGHIVLFDHWHEGHETYWGYEFHGGPMKGPEHSLIFYPYHGLDSYKPYRYNFLSDEPPGTPGTPGGQWVSVTAWPGLLSTIGGIASHFGIDKWQTVWDDPHNAGLRAHRVLPDHVQPGDAVWVPTS
jgi:hypothetical protein